MKAAYDHMTDLKEIKKNYRDEDGAVIIGPRNLYAAPLKKGIVGKGTTFHGQWEHMADPDDDEKKKRRSAIDKNLEIIAKVHESKNFSQRCRTVGSFNSVRQRLGPPEIPQEFKPKPARPTISCEHERAFRPAMPIRTGQVRMSLSPFPDYMENPPKELKRKVVVEGEPDPPPAFRLTHRKKTSPSPSVVCNLRNMKASFPSVFHRSALR